MHHLLESYRINTTWLIRTNSFIILSSFLIRGDTWLCAGSFAPKYHSSSSSLENIWNASRWTSAHIQDAVVWNRNAWITLSTCTGSISIQWIAQLVSLMTLTFVMILHYPLESVINHDLITNRGSTLSSLSTIWFCNSVILICAVCES